MAKNLTHPNYMLKNRKNFNILKRYVEKIAKFRHEGKIIES